jgi:hypothetical protein
LGGFHNRKRKKYGTLEGFSTNKEAHYAVQTRVHQGTRVYREDAKGTTWAPLLGQRKLIPFPRLEVLHGDKGYRVATQRDPKVTFPFGEQPSLKRMIEMRTPRKFFFITLVKVQEEYAHAHVIANLVSTALRGFMIWSHDQPTPPGKIVVHFIIEVEPARLYAGAWISLEKMDLERGELHHLNIVPVRTFSYPLLHLMRRETPLVNARSWNFSLEKANQINKLQREKKSFRDTWINLMTQPTCRRELFTARSFRRKIRRNKRSSAPTREERRSMRIIVRRLRMLRRIDQAAEEKSTTDQVCASGPEESNAGAEQKEDELVNTGACLSSSSSLEIGFLAFAYC